MIELARGFQSYHEGDWRKLAGDLPAWRSEDGIAIGPIYRPGDGAIIARDSGGRPWDIVATVTAAAVSNAVAEIRTEVTGGATGIELLFASSPSSRGHGITAPVEDWARLLDAIPLDQLVLRIDGGEETAKPGAGLFAFLASSGRPRSLALAFDPIATLAAHGWLTKSVEETGAAAAELERRFAENGIAGQVLVADGRLWHNAGASEAEELAAVVAAVAEYLRLLEPNGVSPDRAIASIGVTLAADADQFVTIAKLRAMRLLHARLVEAAEIAPVPCRIHVETSWRMLSRVDPHNNILRTTAAVAAAGMGGADSITALPFDAADGSGDPFARRIARNSQTILIEEAGLARVADPGAGSGAIEALTNALAENAWERFRSIEREGGLLAAVLSGSIQRSLTKSREARAARLRQNGIQIIGANAYPDPKAKPAPSRKIQARPTAPARPVVTADRVQLARLTEAIGA